MSQANHPLLQSFAAQAMWPASIDSLLTHQRQSLLGRLCRRPVVPVGRPPSTSSVPVPPSSAPAPPAASPPTASASAPAASTLARPGKARQGKTRHVRQEKVRQEKTAKGTTRRDETRKCETRKGKTRRDSQRYYKARRDKKRWDKARLGKVRQRLKDGTTQQCFSPSLAVNYPSFFTPTNQPSHRCFVAGCTTFSLPALTWCEHPYYR